MMQKPTVHEVNWQSLRRKGFSTIQTTAEVVNNQTVAGLTIHALQTLNTRTVSRGRLNQEAHINTKSLTTLGA
jgi:hypothetical protein